MIVIFYQSHDLQNTLILQKYRNTCERNLLKKPILALVKKHILYSEDDLEKPRGQISSCEQRRLSHRLIWVFTGCTGLIVLKVFSKFSWFLFPQSNFIPLICAASDLGLHCLHFKFLARLNNVQGELLYWRWRPQMLKFSLKFLRPHYFLTLSPIWFIFGMMIHFGPKFCAVPSPPL